MKLSKNFGLEKSKIKLFTYRYASPEVIGEKLGFN